jgi:hypothetical protein
MLRSLGMTTIFGNPGSTELPFLETFPEDFTYVLGLQESVVLAMADGYAQAKRHATLVNLHTAPGLGNAMGAMVNAFHGRTPLVITAGQQDRRHLALEALLHERLVELAKPYVKWSHEPARAEDVPAAIARAYHTATQEPQGPVFVSIPMDDWEAEAPTLRGMPGLATNGPRPRSPRACGGRVAGEPAACHRGRRRRCPQRCAARGRGPGREAQRTGVERAALRARAVSAGPPPLSRPPCVVPEVALPTTRRVRRCSGARSGGLQVLPLRSRSRGGAGYLRAPGNRRPERGREGGDGERRGR